MVDARVHDEEVVVFGEGMGVYAVEAAFEGGTAVAGAGGEEAGVCFLSPFPSRGTDRVMILCDVEMQKVLIGKIAMAFCTAVHVRLLVMHVVGLV